MKRAKHRDGGSTCVYPRMASKHLPTAGKEHTLSSGRKVLLKGKIVCHFSSEIRLLCESKCVKKAGKELFGVHLYDCIQLDDANDDDEALFFVRFRIAVRLSSLAFRAAKLPYHWYCTYVGFYCG